MCLLAVPSIGISSYHDNGAEDRRWRMRTCRVSAEVTLWHKYRYGTHTHTCTLRARVLTTCFHPSSLNHVSARPLLRSAATATTATLTLRPMHAHVRWHSFVFVCTSELLVPKSIDRCGVKAACCFHASPAHSSGLLIPLIVCSCVLACVQV